MGFHFLGRSRCLYWVAKCKCSCYSCYSGTRAGVQLKPRKGKLCSVYKPQTATCHRFIPGHLLKLACGGWGLCCFFVGLFFSSFSLSLSSFFLLFSSSLSLLFFLPSFLSSFFLSYLFWKCRRGLFWGVCCNPLSEEIIQMNGIANYSPCRDGSWYSVR